MRKAAAIVTDSGGMTCHAAIVSRELGIPCLVGTGDGDRAACATASWSPWTPTHSVVREGAAPAPPRRRAAPRRPRPPAPVTGTKLLVNLSEPSQVERAAALDVEGVGLLRAELMVIEALEGDAPAPAARAGPRRRVRRSAWPRR